MSETHCHHHTSEMLHAQLVQAQQENAGHTHEAIHHHLGATCCGGLCGGHDHAHHIVEHAARLEAVHTQSAKKKAKGDRRPSWLIQLANVQTAS